MHKGLEKGEMVRSGKELKKAKTSLQRAQRGGYGQQERWGHHQTDSVGPGRWSTHLDSHNPTPGSSPGDSEFYFLSLISDEPAKVASCSLE